MKKYIYNESLLLKRLIPMANEQKIAFALSCASRQAFAIEKYVEKYSINSIGYAKNIIVECWSFLLNGSTINWLDIQEELTLLLPEEQEKWSPFHVYADHGLSSLIYTVRCILNPLEKEAAWSARRSYESVDQAAICDLRKLNKEFDNESEILGHLIVQIELYRQERDLLLLESNLSIIQKLKILIENSLKESSLTIDQLS